MRVSGMTKIASTSGSLSPSCRKSANERSIVFPLSIAKNRKQGLHVNK